MRKSWMIFISAGMLSLIFLIGCSDTKMLAQEENSIYSVQESDLAVQEREEDMEENILVEIPETKTDPLELEPAVLLYQGQASIRVVTDEGKVIYIDPYAGDSYDLSADLILVTHSHFDHSQIDKVENKNETVKLLHTERQYEMENIRSLTLALLQWKQ